MTLDVELEVGVATRVAELGGRSELEAPEEGRLFPFPEVVDNRS